MTEDLCHFFMCSGTNCLKNKKRAGILDREITEPLANYSCLDSCRVFQEYVDFFIKGHEDETGGQIKCVYENVNDRWEVSLFI